MRDGCAPFKSCRIYLKRGTTLREENQTTSVFELYDTSTQTPTWLVKHVAEGIVLEGQKLPTIGLGEGVENLTGSCKPPGQKFCLGANPCTIFHIGALSPAYCSYVSAFSKGYPITLG